MTSDPHLNPSGNPHLATNLARWEELALLHPETASYDVAGFRAGRNALKPIEIRELTDVVGRSLLHLMCHFGLDTLSWARMGARVTGVDWSANAIAVARALAADTGIDARFVQSNVYDLPASLGGTFDIVFTSYGVLGWLPDLRQWAEVIATFLAPGGRFYIVEAHPTAWLFDDAPGATELRVAYPYFGDAGPVRTDSDGSYADRSAAVVNRTEYCWSHGLGEIVTALSDAGLRVQFLHEHRELPWQLLPFMTERGDGMWTLPGGQIAVPLAFSLLATR